MDLSICLQIDFSGIFGIMEKAHLFHVLLHCSMASEVMKSSVLFFISTNCADIIGRTFFW